MMQKFSKKLVSKVIYVKILRSSSTELIENFLNEKGWELLNQWFTEAIKTSNWALCTELLELFAQCPMTAARLKENVEQNQAPKLIRQLSCDLRIDQKVRLQAEEVRVLSGKLSRNVNKCCSRRSSRGGWPWCPWCRLVSRET